MKLKMSINSRNKSNGKLEVDVNVKIRYICPILSSFSTILLKSPIFPLHFPVTSYSKGFSSMDRLVGLNINLYLR